MPWSKYKFPLICSEGANVWWIPNHLFPILILLTELWSCSNDVFYEEQNSMETALSSKIFVTFIFSVLLSVVLFLTLSSVARISFYFKWFSKYSGNLFPNFSTYGGWGNECRILSFARFLMSSASDWAVRFRLPPPFLQTAPLSGPLNSFL